ncbi:MAG: hypothetical protein OK449_04390 [Thaumarchaeota archaeon]|nr:hypothetical protein [Nitrososphaerota archaeon]
MVILIVVLAITAVAVGVGVQSSSSNSSQYGCISFVHQGNNLEVTTSGIIHISGSQYYVSCAEGVTDPTTPTTVSCLTISPHASISPYPDASTAYWYYLSAPGHTITVPNASTNSSEVLQPANPTIMVSC